MKAGDVDCSVPLGGSLLRPIRRGLFQRQHEQLICILMLPAFADKGRTPADR